MGDLQSLGHSNVGGGSDWSLGISSSGGGESDVHLERYIDQSTSLADVDNFFRKDADEANPGEYYFLRIKNDSQEEGAALQPMVVNIIVSGRTQFLAEELEDKTRRCFSVLRNVIIHDRVLPGSGVSEMVCSRAVSCARETLALDVEGEGDEALEMSHLLGLIGKALEEAAYAIQRAVDIHHTTSEVKPFIHATTTLKEGWWCHSTETKVLAADFSRQLHNCEDDYVLDDWYSKRCLFERAFALTEAAFSSTTFI